MYFYFYFAVIELACGEYGDVLPILSKSYRDGKCEEYSKLQSDFNSLSSSHSLSIALGDFPTTSSNGHSPNATFKNGTSKSVTVYTDGSGRSQTVVKVSLMMIKLILVNNNL